MVVVVPRKHCGVLSACLLMKIDLVMSGAE